MKFKRNTSPSTGDTSVKWRNSLHKPSRLEIKKVASAATHPQTSRFSWLAVSAGIVSLGTVILILLGFGVSLAVESTFGIPHAAVFESTFELVDLASVAMLEVIPSLVDSIADGSLVLFQYELYGSEIGVIFVVFVVVVFFGWFVRPRKKWMAPLKVTPQKKENLHWGFTAKRYIWGNIVIGISILIYPIFSMLGVIAIAFCALMLSTVPVVGMGAGKAYIAKWVIGPAQCVPVIDLETRRKPSDTASSAEAKKSRTVHCVALKKGKELIASGRVVFLTSKAVVLVEESGKAKRVPTAGVVIEAIDSLPASKTLRTTSPPNVKSTTATARQIPNLN